MSNFWTHFCPCEKEEIGVERGSACNWCDTPEPPPLALVPKSTIDAHKEAP